MGIGILVLIGHSGSCMDLGQSVPPAGDCSLTTSIFGKRYTTTRPHQYLQIYCPYLADQCLMTLRSMRLEKSDLVPVGGICLACIDLCVIAAAAHRSALPKCPRIQGRHSAVCSASAPKVSPTLLYALVRCIACLALAIVCLKSGHQSVLHGRGITRDPSVWYPDWA